MAFDYPTNFSDGSAVAGIGSLLTYASYTTNGFFGIGILAVIFFLAFGVGYLVNFSAAFASASFITFVFSVYFVRIDLVPYGYPFILAAMTIIAFFMAKAEQGGNI